MKAFNILLFVFVMNLFHSLNFAFSQSNVHYINGYKFEFRRDIVSSDYGSKVDRVIYLYRNGQYVLKHYEKRYFADCNNDYISFGDFSISGDNIIFNTEYSQSGADPIPEKRRQRYQVNSSGKLILLSDREYYSDLGWVNSTFKY